MKIQRSTGDNGMMSIIKGGNAIHGPLLKTGLMYGVLLCAR